MSRSEPLAPWSQHDAAIWHACDIATAVLAGTVSQRPVVLSSFPPQLAAEERLLAHGGFDLLTHRATGDGSYAHDGSVFYAGGRGGLALTAGFAAARAAGNQRRRAAAAAEAAPRWVVADVGELWVSTHGFYMQTAQGLFPWSWAAVQSAQQMAPASLLVQGASEAGPVSWMLRSDWAELVFVLWALAVHPDHSSLSRGAWLPPGWRERCQRAGYLPGSAATGLVRTSERR